MIRLFFVVFLFAVAHPARAQDPGGLAAPAAAIDSSIDSPGLSDFVDGLIEGQLEAHDIPGAAVAIVEGGEVLFARGYGFADDEAKRRADEHTLFRIGSISKLFVWTAVMQLVEEGAIDLDADVNAYLESVEVPATFPEPVTMTHLLTHTPGFEDRGIGLFARDAAAIRPLSEVLAEDMPWRVRPPGVVPSYSNHGSALAALVVEDTAGEPWIELIEKRVLRPLGMESTTFRQPVPEVLLQRLSRGYDRRGEEIPFEYIPLAPAGACSASAADMARFMLAHLNDGALGEARILGEDTARRMRSPLFVPVEGMNAMCHGFYEMSVRGVRIVGHGGDTIAFHSQLGLLPDHGFGYFVSYNGEKGGTAKAEFKRALLERLFPRGDAAAPPAAASAGDRSGDFERYAGWYRPNRYSHSDLGKVAAAMSQRIAATDEGLRFAGSMWRPVAPGRFQEVDGDRVLGFREEGGEVTHAFLDVAPMLAFERAGAIEIPPVQAASALAAVCTLLLAFALWPLSWMLRRYARATADPEALVPVFARGVAWLLSLTMLLFCGALAGVAASPMSVAFGMPRFLDLALWLPLAALPLAGTVAIAALFVLFKRRGRLLGRLYYAWFALVSCVLLWQLHHFNAIDWSRVASLAERIGIA